MGSVSRNPPSKFNKGSNDTKLTASSYPCPQTTLCKCHFYTRQELFTLRYDTVLLKVCRCNILNCPWAQGKSKQSLQCTATHPNATIITCRSESTSVLLTEPNHFVAWFLLLWCCNAFFLFQFLAFESFFLCLFFFWLLHLFLCSFFFFAFGSFFCTLIVSFSQII